MPASSSNWSTNGSDRAAAVSIILPTYNRARFLPQAIESIQSQQFSDWELIVIDDGSTDETPELIRSLTAEISQNVQYIRQENQGAYAARNTGLDHARGECIAFFDSDDVWLPHHLQDCVAALNANQDVDWVYGACRIVDESSGDTQVPNTFYSEDTPRPFLLLQSQRRGAMRVFDDASLVECMILHGIFCGLQNSVIRGKVFGNRRFKVAYRHEGEDRTFALRAAAEGCRFGCFDNVHVVYKVHSQNSTWTASSRDLVKQQDIFVALVNARKELLDKLDLTRRQRSALRRRISRELFWQIGYSTQWQRGCRLAALGSFLRAIAVYPWVSSYWKTLAACTIRAGLGIGRDKDHAV